MHTDTQTQTNTHQHRHTRTDTHAHTANQCSDFFCISHLSELGWLAVIAIAGWDLGMTDSSDIVADH